MMNEETSEKSVQVAVQVTKRAALALLRKAAQKLQQQKTALQANRRAAKAYGKEHLKGRQTVKQLIGQEQGVTSVDISEIGIKDFDRYARKYGVDYAVLKSKDADPPKYTVFFKARDADAITSLVSEYTASQLKAEKQARPSLRDRLSKFKDIVASIPRKVVEKRKEQVL